MFTIKLVTHIHTHTHTHTHTLYLIIVSNSNIQGLKSDGEVDHDRVGEVYTTLVALLKAKSKVFATNIGKQVVCGWVGG